MTEQPYIVDARVGCVAVYRGPMRECLSDGREDDFVFYRQGKRDGFCGAWQLPSEAVREAHTVCDRLNA